MSGVAVFSLKYPSLLQFDQHQDKEELVRKNLRALYGIKQAPSLVQHEMILSEGTDSNRK